MEEDGYDLADFATILVPCGCVCLFELTVFRNCSIVLEAWPILGHEQKTTDQIIFTIT